MSRRIIYFTNIWIILFITSCSSSINNTSTTINKVTEGNNSENIFDNRQCAEVTARNIEPYRTIQSGMSYLDICKIVGIPDNDVGSGIYVFQYNLDDGSDIKIGFISLDKVYYVYHSVRNNQGEWKIIERIVNAEL
jgi:hypothetical protein